MKTTIKKQIENETGMEIKILKKDKELIFFKEIDFNNLYSAKLTKTGKLKKSGIRLFLQ